METFKIAIVYGKSVKHQPQRVGLTHQLEDEDISKCPDTVVNYEVLGLMKFSIVTIIKRG